MELHKHITDVWKPCGSGQARFIQARRVTEVIYGGGRRIGKSTSLLMSFLDNCRIGYGDKWRGIAFFNSQLGKDEFHRTCKMWIPRIFPDAIFNSTHFYWKFADGECLYYGLNCKKEDYADRPGEWYNWIGFDNMLDWKNEDCYKQAFALLKIPQYGDYIPAMVRGTTLLERDEKDHHAPADNWVNKRFSIPYAIGETQYGIAPNNVPPWHDGTLVVVNSIYDGGIVEYPNGDKHEVVA